MAYLSLTPTIFKAGLILITGSPADLILWTPAAGKRFRLMRFVLQIPNATMTEQEGHAAVVHHLQFKDGASLTGIATSVWINGSGGIYTPFTGSYLIDRDLGNGYLSTAVNNQLVLNCATFMSDDFFRGGVQYQLHGTEE